VQDLNEFVAISEEFANSVSGTVKSGGLLFDRRVTRTITPGTLIDEKFMDPFENNFLLALNPLSSAESSDSSRQGIIPIELKNSSLHPSVASKPIGLAWLDLSTGDFFTQTTTLGTLPSTIARIGAREIVISEGLEEKLVQSIMKALEQQRHLVTHHRTNATEDSISSWTPMLEAEVPEDVQSAFTREEVVAGSLLLSYVQERLQGLGIKLQPPVRRQDKETMSMDKNSMRALEVLGTSRDGVGAGKGSLLHTVRRTVTKSGTRLLRDWIASPSMSIPAINARLDLVSRLLEDRSFREDLTNFLRRTFDSQRLVQKFAMGRGQADDLISLLRTIEASNGIARLLGSQVGSFTDTSSTQLDQRQSLHELSSRLSLDGPNALAKSIAASIDEDGLMESHRTDASAGTDIINMAQEVLETEGSAEEQSILSQATRAKAKQKSTADSEVEKVEATDTWILRKT